MPWGKMIYDKNNQYDVLKLLNSFSKSNEYEKYLYYKQFIDRKNYRRPDSIHGVLHSSRVLMISMINSMISKLSDKDIKFLGYASVYHDIGRVNDGTDIEHGKRSVLKLKDLEVFENVIKNEFNDEEIKILDFIIENHVIDDKDGLENLKNSNILDKEYAKRMLFYFKDSDGLDRVRVWDVDSNFLRHDTSKALVDIAIALYKEETKLL